MLTLVLDRAAFRPIWPGPRPRTRPIWQRRGHAFPSRPHGAIQPRHRRAPDVLPSGGRFWPSMDEGRRGTSRPGAFWSARQFRTTRWRREICHRPEVEIPIVAVGLRVSLRSLDANRDGVIDPREIPEDRRRFFNFMAERAGLDPNRPVPIDRALEMARLSFRLPTGRRGHRGPPSPDALACGAAIVLSSRGPPRSQRSQQSGSSSPAAQSRAGARVWPATGKSLRCRLWRFSGIKFLAQPLFDESERH